MKQPLVDDGRSEQARARWQRTEGIAAAVGRIAAVGRAPKTVIAKVDLFAIDLKPSTVAGGVISVLVLLGTVIYTALITYAYVHRDASQSNNMLWSQASRTLFPMNVTCVAASCILSNTYPGASLPTPPSPAEACLRLGFNETTVLHLAFSNDPSDGLAILFDPTATDSAFPLGAGVYVSSEMGCDGGPGCVDDIIIMRLLVGPGLTLANYVRTNNETEPAGSRARLRQEWFLSYVSDAHSVSTARPCFAALSGAEVEGLQQARIRMVPFYNVIDVVRESFWLTLWGTCGGAFGTFLQVGTALLLACSFLSRFVRGGSPDPAAAPGGEAPGATAGSHTAAAGATGGKGKGGSFGNGAVYPEELTPTPSKLGPGWPMGGGGKEGAGAAAAPNALAPAAPAWPGTAQAEQAAARLPILAELAADGSSSDARHYHAGAAAGPSPSPPVRPGSRRCSSSSAWGEPDAGGGGGGKSVVSVRAVDVLSGRSDSNSGSGTESPHLRPMLPPAMVESLRPVSRGVSGSGVGGGGADSSRAVPMASMERQPRPGSRGRAGSPGGGGGLAAGRAGAARPASALDSPRVRAVMSNDSAWGA